ncbi:MULTISPECIES: SPW repeat protein [unclassified Streptomyces]|uniref:SPW repeat protein n=1 Tax=unclassified Streptomyces TaxID=2593676 RepID=UPI002285819E|nr:SPW repeat protein [Streptomyces sp. Je 1-369]WAM00510.1 SPW repeat protein [Streptomyces sp. Je 1-369]
MDTHPDIVDMRARHESAERAASTPKVQAIDALAFLTGLYLAASPWIAGFNQFTRLSIVNLIVGIAYALLMSGGFGRAYERSHGMAWAACALGIWTIVAPWAIAGDATTRTTVVSNVITGAVAALLALAASAAARAGDKSQASHGRNSAQTRRDMSRAGHD